MKRLALTAAVAGALLLPACTHTVKVEPIEFKEIRATVNINLKVDRALDDFFDFEDETEDSAPEGGER